MGGALNGLYYGISELVPGFGTDVGGVCCNFSNFGTFQVPKRWGLICAYCTW